MVVIHTKFCKTDFELYRVGSGMRYIVILGLVVGLTSCAVVGVITAVVSTAVKVATVPVKVIGAAVEVVTPDDDKPDDKFDDTSEN
jgi:heme/copper-type cytochrome/quinol oxidase subunit 4